MEPLRLGIAGLGTVAQGLLTLLKRNAALLEARAGRPIEVVAVASRTEKDVDLLGGTFDHDVMALAARNDVDLVVELIGGEAIALDLVRTSLRQGRAVVTANKAIMAGAGDELVGQAQANNAALGFEAAVAGGIPIINALSQGLVANDFSQITGIINGTCNYILTAMTEDGEAFESALSRAQELGYAEADPTFDVGGIDAAHKLTILSALAFGTPLDRDAMTIEGIESVTADDIADAKALGYVIKHLGIARRSEEGVEARVHPAFVPAESMIASVNGVMNAVHVLGNATGGTLYYGPGAGGEATASAVLADIVAIARGSSAPLLTGSTTSPPWLPMADTVSAAYLRIPAVDEAGVFAKIATILSDHSISIEGAIQSERAVSDRKVPISVVTQPVRDGQIVSAVQALEALPEVVGAVRRIRVEHIDG